MTRDLRETYSVDNLKLAWKRLNTGSNRFYKNYFRHLYRAYSIAETGNLKELNKRLRNSSYAPTHATKVYTPKPSGLQRTITLLSVEDQIVCQSFVNIIANRLFPRVRRRYMREVFGHLYVGKQSKFFYRDWHRTYAEFSNAIRRAFRNGFVYTASFDLTACFDSIDHNVLNIMLCDLGLQQEFVSQLCNYLKHWTAASSDELIYQGHGIPQGPISSGLLADVVLGYFDSHRLVNARRWRYFRYVDDIRIFAENEHDLRVMLVHMDLLSKRLGLFPQSSKIGIHIVRDIDVEIKTISKLVDTDVVARFPDQSLVLEQIRSLSNNARVTDETKFKYWLGAAVPSAPLSAHLLRVVNRSPHLYEPVFRYLSRYSQLPHSVCVALLGIMQRYIFYPAVPADGLRLLRDACHPRDQNALVQFASDILNTEGSVQHAELYAAIQSVLLAYNRLSYESIVGLLTESSNWWVRAYLTLYIPEMQIGRPSYATVINSLLCDKSDDVGIVAAHIVADQSLDLEEPISNMGTLAQLSLKQTGFIAARRGGPCPISNAMSFIFGSSVSRINWRHVLGALYRPSIPKVAMLRAYFQTDPTAWVNLIDTIHDDLVYLIFGHHGGALGQYNRGSIGTVLHNPPQQFTQSYPRTLRAFSRVHGKRLESALSHSTTRRTGRSTRYITHDEMARLIPIVRAAYLEIWISW